MFLYKPKGSQLKTTNMSSYQIYQCDEGTFLPAWESQNWSQHSQLECQFLLWRGLEDTVPENYLCACIVTIMLRMSFTFVMLSLNSKKILAW